MREGELWKLGLQRLRLLQEGEFQYLELQHLLSMLREEVNGLRKLMD